MSAVSLTRSGAVATITLDRPPVNALDQATYADITQVIDAVSRDDHVLAVVLASASPRVFCAGADVEQFVELAAAEEFDWMANEERQRVARTMLSAVRLSPKPVIAALNGPVIGAGAVLAACCDIRYAEPGAWLALTEVNVARCGGGRHLMRLMPQGRLRELFFTGDRLSAEEAHRLGVYDRIVEAGTVRAEAAALAERIATKSPLALRLAKASLNACEQLGVEDGYALEQQHSLRLAHSHDHREAARAFVEKREPSWTGS